MSRLLMVALVAVLAAPLTVHSQPGVSILVKGAHSATRVSRGATELVTALKGMRPSVQSDAALYEAIVAANPGLATSADVAEAFAAGRAGHLDLSHPLLRENPVVARLLTSRISHVRSVATNPVTALPCHGVGCDLGALGKDIEVAARRAATHGRTVPQQVRLAFQVRNEWSSFLRTVTTEAEVKEVLRLAENVTESASDADAFVEAFYSNLRRGVEAQPAEVTQFLERVPSDWHKSYPVYYSYPNSLKFGGEPGAPATLFDLARAQGLDDAKYSLYVLPFWKGPGPGGKGIDGGFDVVEYTVGDAYGGEAGLQALLSRTRELEVPVIVDIIPNHVSAQHPWVDALRKGDLSMKDRFVVVANDFNKVGERQVGERTYAVYKDGDGNETLRWIIFPHDSRDHIVKLAVEGAEDVRLYHTFYRAQLDLNHRNPAVFDYFLGLETELVNRGILGIRIDAAQHIMKARGTNAEGLPEAFDYIELLNRYAKILGRGKVKIFPEIGAGTGESVAYLGRTTQLEGAGTVPAISDGFWGFQVRSRLPESVVHRTAAPFWALVDEIPANMPKNSTIFAMDMHHDELPAEFLLKPAEHMPELLARGVPFRDGGGVAGRMAPLLQQSDEQLELVWALKTVGIPNSTPVLYYGEEAGLGNSMKHALAQQAAREELLRAQGLEVENAFDARDVHRQVVDFAAVRAAEANFRPSQTYRKLLDLRSRRPSLRSDETPVRLSVGDDEVVAMVRSASDGTDTPILFLANLGEGSKQIRISAEELRAALGNGELTTILTTSDHVSYRVIGTEIEVSLKGESFVLAEPGGSVP